MDDISLTVDGQKIKARKGQMVIEAAREAGIYIPYLCWHPTLKSFGACRMCVVQVENQRGTPASCTTAAVEGMVVSTKSKEVDQIRHQIMDLILSEHPHGCLTCPRIDHCGPQDTCLRHANVVDRCVLCPQNERCELQDVVFHLQMKDSGLPYEYRHVPLDTSNPFIDHDMNLCIVCGRCVRACNEIEAVDAITFIQRGDKTLIGTSLGGPLSDSGCTFCGACVDVCPVGAITEKDHKWSGAPDRSVTTICSNCSVGCQLELLVKRGRVIRTIPDLSGPANRGNACAKGKFGFFFLHSDERLTTPLIRKDGRLVEASWEEALGLISERLARYKGPSFGVVASTRATNEESYLLQKFTRVVMGSNNIDHRDTTCDSSSIAPLGEMLGAAAMTNGFREMVDAKGLLVVGSDMTTDHPVAAIQVKEAAKRGASLIVVDPRETEMALLAGHWLRPRPGTEAALLAGMVKVILDENLYVKEYVAQSCEGLDGLRSSLAATSLGEVEAVTGVGREKLEGAARAYASKSPAAIFYSTGSFAPSLGAQIAEALIDLALLTGNIGKLASGVNPLRADANSHGTADMGCLPNLLPGYASISEGAGRFGQAWGVKLPSEPGLGYRDMMQGAREGRIKAMLIVADTQRVDEPPDLEALKSLEFLVVQDLFLTEAAKAAEVVLPAVSFAEKDGTFTSAERRVQRVNKVINPLGEARPGWQILGDLARRMGASGFDYQTPAQVMGEIASLVPIYGGVRYERLGVKGLQWPCTTTDHPGTPVLHAEGILRGKGLLKPLGPKPSAPETTAGYPLLVLTSTSREMKGVAELNGHIVATLSQQDARALGLSDGDEIEVSTATASLTALARVQPDSPAGVLFLAYPHTQALINTLYHAPASSAWSPWALNGARARVKKLAAVASR